MKWISVKDGLPKPYENVLLRTEKDKQQDSFIGFMGSDNSFESFEMKGLEPEENIVTHWMTLPEPPKD